MINDPSLLTLPDASELPDSDDTPVDNELQILVPTLLYLILNQQWKAREDWFFGVNMGIYHNTGRNPRIPIVPDGFLSLGVPRRQGLYGRSSYIVWLENNIPPIFVLEYVSKTYGGEYEGKSNPKYTPKMAEYAKLGVLYYAIYNPQYYQRDQHEPLEVYRLENGRYQRQAGEPIWMEELGLGIGRENGTFQTWQREWLFWFDEAGKRYLSPEEIILQQEQRSQRLTELLREKGINSDELLG
ncbi:MAG: Uma2 family endonuclease [Crocosphaera sp.]